MKKRRDTPSPEEQEVFRADFFGKSGDDAAGQSSGADVPGVSQATPAPAAAQREPQPVVEQDRVLAHAAPKPDGSSIEVATDENRFFSQTEQARKRASRGRKVAILGVAMLVIFVLVLFLPKGLFGSGFKSLSLALIIQLIQASVSDFAAALTGAHTGGFMLGTICKYFIVMVTGTALGLCGAVYQGAFKNPLAAPSTLGVTTGCSFGQTVYILFLAVELVSTNFVPISQVTEQLGAMALPQYLWTVYGRALSAVAGGVVVVCLVMFLSSFFGKNRAGNVMLIVVGMVISTVLSAFTSLASYYYLYTGNVEKQEALNSLSFAPFNLIDSPLDVLLVCVPLFICLAVVLVLRQKLGLLSLDDDEARSMGLNVSRIRWAMVLACTAVTGIIVAFCGSIGMVGFIVPHIARKVIGADFRYLLPASMFIGGSFLLLCFFIVGQTTLEPVAALNLLTSFIGGGLFLVMAIRNRGDSRGSWV